MLAACGLVPPEANAPLGYSQEVRKKLFYAVIRGVQCEIRRAVRTQKNKFGVEWLKNWSALIRLNLVFETGAEFNPGATFKTPMVPGAVWLGDGARQVFAQNYSMGVGANFSGQVTRTEDVTYFYPFDGAFFSMPDDETEPCYQFGGLTIGADLKLAEWLDDVLEPYKKCAFLGIPETEPPRGLVGEIAGRTEEAPRCSKEEQLVQGYSKDNPIKAFSHRVAFVISAGGSVTPRWNLVRISAPLDSPLFGIRRSATSELTITLGSADTEKVIVKKERGREIVRSVVGPSLEMRNRDLSLQIGSAVRDALR